MKTELRLSIITLVLTVFLVPNIANAYDLILSNVTIDLAAWDEPYSRDWTGPNYYTNDSNVKILQQWSSDKIAAENYYNLKHFIIYRVLIYPNGTEEFIDQYKFDGHNASGYVSLNHNWDSCMGGCPNKYYYLNVTIPNKTISLNDEGTYKIEIRKIELPTPTGYKFPNADWNSTIDLYAGISHTNGLFRYVNDDYNDKFPPSTALTGVLSCTNISAIEYTKTNVYNSTYHTYNAYSYLDCNMLNSTSIENLGCAKKYHVNDGKFINEVSYYYEQESWLDYCWFENKTATNIYLPTIAKKIWNTSFYAGTKLAISDILLCGDKDCKTPAVVGGESYLFLNTTGVILPFNISYLVTGPENKSGSLAVNVSGTMPKYPNITTSKDYPACFNVEQYYDSYSGIWKTRGECAWERTITLNCYELFDLKRPAGMGSTYDNFYTPFTSINNAQASTNASWANAGISPSGSYAGVSINFDTNKPETPSCPIRYQQSGWISGLGGPYCGDWKSCGGYNNLCQNKPSGSSHCQCFDSGWMLCIGNFDPYYSQDDKVNQSIKLNAYVRSGCPTGQQVNPKTNKCEFIPLPPVPLAVPINMQNLINLNLSKPGEYTLTILIFDGKTTDIYSTNFSFGYDIMKIGFYPFTQNENNNGGQSPVSAEAIALSVIGASALGGMYLLSGRARFGISNVQITDDGTSWLAKYKHGRFDDIAAAKANAISYQAALKKLEALTKQKNEENAIVKFIKYVKTLSPNKQALLLDNLNKKEITNGEPPHDILSVLTNFPGGLFKSLRLYAYLGTNILMNKTDAEGIIEDYSSDKTKPLINKGLNNLFWNKQVPNDFVTSFLLIKKAKRCADWYIEMAEDISDANLYCSGIPEEDINNEDCKEAAKKVQTDLVEEAFYWIMDAVMDPAYKKVKVSTQTTEEMLAYEFYSKDIAEKFSSITTPFVSRVSQGLEVVMPSLIDAGIIIGTGALVGVATLASIPYNAGTMMLPSIGMNIDGIYMRDEFSYM